MRCTIMDKKMAQMILLETKGYIYAYKRILFSLFAGLMVGSILWLGAEEFADRGSLFEPFTVGVVDHDGTPELVFIYNFFNEYIMDLEFMNKEQAQRLLAAGEIPAYIELPENFTQDVFQGVNTPFIIHTSGRFPLQAGLVQLLATGGIAYLSASQAGVFGTFEYAIEAGMTWQEVQQQLLFPVNIAFVQELIHYDDMFIREVLPLVEGNISDYFISRFAVFWYMLNLVALVKFLSRYPAGVMDRFKIAGVSGLRVFGVKFAGLFAVMLFLAVFIMPVTGVLPGLFLAIFTTGFGLFAGRLFKQDRAAALFIFFTALFMYFASGGIIPFVFLPQELWVMRYFSINYWVSVL